MGTKDKTPSSKLCIEVRKFITTNLKKIIGYLGKGLKFEYFIQCPEYNGVSINCLIPVSRLKEEEEVCCEFDDHMIDDYMNDHMIESCKVLDFWFEDQEQTVIEGNEEGKESKASEKGEDASMNRVKGVPCSDPKLLCQLLQKSQQAACSSQSLLEANCLSVGLVLHGETPADGNCFFEAVSSQLRRLNCVVQKSPQQLRQEVVEFMRTNRVIQASEGTIDLVSFIYNESFDVYCSRMVSDGEWADHVVVVAMARMLKIDIMIVTSSPLSSPEHIVWVVGQTAFQEDPILLGHVWESHYMSLQPIAPVVLDQNLAGHSTQAQADVPTPSPTAEIMQMSASGSTSSTTVGLIQAPTTNATPSLTSITAGVMQTTTSSFIRTDLMQASAYGSTTAVMQAPTSVHTKTNVLFSTTSASTLSTTTGSTTRPTPTSTTAVVMQYPSSGSTANVIQITTSGSTAANVIQTPTSGSTAANVIQTPTSGSTAGAEASKVKSQMQAGAKKELDEPQTKVKNIDCQDTDDVDAPITQEHINHARLCNALTNVCSNALREILLTNVPTSHTDIYKAILAKKADLKKKLNKEQVSLVFPDPQGLSTGKVEEFDISLLCTIIRNISSVPAPSNGWGKPPADNPRDTTLGANVERIRSYRNHIVGHDVHGKISQQEFEDYWAKIDEVLREIEIFIGNRGYREDLEKRKNQVITTHEAYELQKTFQEYKKRKEAEAFDIESAAETLMSKLKKFRGNQN